MPLPGHIRVGIPVSLTGQFQTQGKQALAGLQSWANDVNAAGGLRLGSGPGGVPKRYPVQVYFQDDRSRVEGVRRATDHLLTSDRVDLLFGPYSSGLTTAAAAVAEERHRLMWNQGGASDDVYQKGYRGIIGVLTPASRYLAGLLPMIREADSGARTVGILRATPGAFPKAVSSGVERSATELRFNVEFVWEFDAATRDFSELTAAAASRRPDVLVVVGRIANDLALAELLAGYPQAFRAVAVVASPIDQFHRALGPLVDGFLGPSQWERDADYEVDFGPTGEEALASMGRQSSLAPDYPMVQAYAAGLVAQRCVEEAGTLDETQLRTTASKLDFSTFYGRFKIDADSGRQVGRDVVLVQWQQGRKIIVFPPKQRRGTLVCPWRPK